MLQPHNTALIKAFPRVKQYQPSWLTLQIGKRRNEYSDILWGLIIEFLGGGTLPGGKSTPHQIPEESEGMRESPVVFFETDIVDQFHNRLTGCTSPKR